MKLGLNLGYWGMGNDATNLELAREADRLGFDVIWAAEAYGSDSPTVLAWVGAQCPNVDIGSAVMQIPARTPATTAMTAATLDTLSGGRFRLGLGLSGPQVSEGWHGVPYTRPIGRTREYVEIVQMALRRDRLAYDGTSFTLPVPDGPGKALKLTVHPVREHIPIYLASVGPKNLALTGEIADGWLSIFFSPEHSTAQIEAIAAARGAIGKDMTGFDVVAQAGLVIGDDLEACADEVRPNAALYVGGMGSREQNFYNRMAGEMGFGEQAAVIQDRYLAKDYAGAAAAVPFEFVDGTSLLGPLERIAERMKAFADAGVTTLNIPARTANPDEGKRYLSLALEALELSGAAA